MIDSFKYSNQIDVLKNFIDSHQLLFKAEIEELKKFYDNQINCMRQNYFNNLSDMKNEYEQVINQLKECKDLDSLENLVAKLDSNFNEIAQIKTTSNDLLCDFKETKQDLLQNQLHFSQCNFFKTRGDEGYLAEQLLPKNEITLKRLIF